MSTDAGPSDVVAMLAVTLDGFICREDGAVDFLDKYQPGESSFDFEGFLAEVGSIVMGRTSYEQALDWGWTWASKPVLVMTSQEELARPDEGSVEFSSAPTADAVRSFAERHDGRTWVFGGGTVVTDALLGGAVDTLDLTIVPDLIGTGIPLFTAPVEVPLTPVHSETFDGGAVRLVCRVGD